MIPIRGNPINSYGCLHMNLAGFTTVLHNAYGQSTQYDLLAVDGRQGTANMPTTVRLII